jgi:DNA-binding beta-propeller fold protein YncE
VTAISRHVVILSHASKLARAMRTILCVLLLGCGSSADQPQPVETDSALIEDSAIVVDDTMTMDTATTETAPPGCMRTAKPEGAPRKVVISHPFDAAGKKSGAMEVLELASDGTLGAPSGKTFALTTAAFEPIVFTPDGEVGLVAEDDGTVGVFKFDAAGAVSVVHAAFKGKFYANKIVIDPSGQRALIIDPNTEENGGGIHAVDIACDGTLTEKGKLVPAKTWSVFKFLSDTRAVVAGGPGLGSPATVDAHLLNWKAMPSLIASTAPFGDRDAIPSWMDVMPDGKLALVADNGIIKGSRVAVFGITDATLTPLQILPMDNPAAVVASPYGNQALVLNSDGKDGFTILKMTGPATAPFVNAGKLVYVHGKPALPSVAAMIARGPLKGRVLIAENVAVRSLQFTSDGFVTDIAKLTFPSGLQNIVGTIGVQP